MRGVVSCLSSSNAARARLSSGGRGTLATAAGRPPSPPARSGEAARVLGGWSSLSAGWRCASRPGGTSPHPGPGPGKLPGYLAASAGGGALPALTGESSRPGRRRALAGPGRGALPARESCPGAGALWESGKGGRPRLSIGGEGPLPGAEVHYLPGRVAPVTAPVRGKGHLPRLSSGPRVGPGVSGEKRFRDLNERVTEVGEKGAGRSPLTNTREPQVELFD